MTNIDIPYSKTFLKSLLEIQNDGPQYCPDDISGSSEIDICYTLMKNITTRSWNTSSTGGGNIRDCSALSQGVFVLDNDDSKSAQCCKGDINKSCYEYLQDYSGNTNTDSQLLGAVFPKDDYFTGIYEYDYNGSGSLSGKICLTAPFKKKFPDFENFIRILLWGISAMLVTVLFATSAEFWLKYGESIDCIFYRSRCGNLNENNKSSIIDYIFPAHICYYPYQKCLYEDSKSIGGSNQRGGAGDNNIKYGFNSKFQEYKANGAKCITIHESKETANSRIFPYNLADMANDYIGLEFLRKPLKAISFFAAFSNIVGRWFINGFFKKLSVIYQDHIQSNDILNTIIYIILFFFSSIILIFIILSSVFGTFMAGTIASTTFGAMPEAFLKKALDKCKNGPEDGAKYYELFSLMSMMSVVFFPKDGEEPPGIGKRILNFFFNFIKCLLLFPWNMLIWVIGLITSLLCCFWQIITFVFFFFYVPLSNNLEFLDLIKSHGIFLTLYFCSIIITASSQSLDNTTTGVMGGCLALVAVYYLIKYFGN